MDAKQAIRIMRGAFRDGRILSGLEPDETDYTYVYAYRLGVQYSQGKITLETANAKLNEFLKGL